MRAGRAGAGAARLAERRVLVAFHEEVLGGATLSVLRLVPELERRGWRFTFWVPDPSPLAGELRERGHEVHGAPRPIAYSLRALRLPPGPGRRLAALPGYLLGFRRHVARLGPAIVHLNSLFTLAEAAVARSTGARVVFHVHEMVKPGRKGALARRAGFAVADEVVAVSEASAAALATGTGRPRIVHECAPIPTADPPARLDDGPLVVGTVGVISRRKGSDLFVEAARIVAERGGGVEFRMIGAPTDALDVGWAGEVLDRARAGGIAHADRTDVPAALREWDVFALPSRWDPFPISLLEAMGSGLPVVGTAVDGIPEQITPEVGILVEPESPEALAEAILRLRSDPALRQRMGAAARRRALAEFDLPHQADGLEAAYLAALERRA